MCKVLFSRERSVVGLPGAPVECCPCSQAPSPIHHLFFYFMTLNETNINNANTKEKMNQNHEVSTLPRGLATDFLCQLQFLMAHPKPAVPRGPKRTQFGTEPDSP